MLAQVWTRDVGCPAWQPLLSLDGPSWLFLAPVLLVTALAAVYAPAYLVAERYRHESGWRFGLFYALFAAGMVVTLLAADFVTFLVGWETMTLASYVLVVHETRDPTVLRAGFKYFAMTHVGTGALLFAAVLLRAWGGSFAFDRLPAAFAALASAHPAALHAVLALAFVGFATKAGLWPFGDWLPDAHPAAPAPVSAVLSGVMIKLGLYGVLRLFVLALGGAMPAAAAGWGWVLAGFGLFSAIAGGAAACTAGDTKVLLAQSSIAQSGLIALGFGAALVLAPQHPALAALALLGATFHVVGDAVVKALLFLVAGSLQWRTNSRRLEDLGGLFQAMPVTGTAALIGAFCIAGLPPLTAFTGKWLMLQATVLSSVPGLSVAGIGLLFASLFSVLYAARFFAGAFANRPMRPGALEVPLTMRAVTVALAAVAVAIGLFPGAVLAWLRALLADVPAMAAAGAVPLGRVLGPASGAFAPLLLVATGAWAFALVRLAVGRAEAPKTDDAWAGGVPSSRGAPPIHPHGFYSPVREGLARAYPALHWRAIPRPAWLPPAVDLDRWGYGPVSRVGRRLAEGLRRMHTGAPNLYLAWQLAGAAALALLLLWLRT